MKNSARRMKEARGKKFANHILQLQRYCRVTFHLIIPDKYIKNNKFSGFIVTVIYDFEQLYDNDTYQIYLLSTKHCTTKTHLQLLWTFKKRVGSISSCWLSVQCQNRTGKTLRDVPLSLLLILNKSLSTDNAVNVLGVKNNDNVRSDVTVSFMLTWNILMTLT